MQSLCGDSLHKRNRHEPAVVSGSKVFNALAEYIRDQAEMSAIGGCCIKMVVQTDNMITSIVVGCSIANTGQHIKLVKQGVVGDLCYENPIKTGTKSIGDYLYQPELLLRRMSSSHCRIF